MSDLSAADIDSFLAWRMVRTGRAVERALVAAIGEHELTATEFGVLSLLSTGAQLTQSDLARAVLIRPQSVGTLITGLMQRGLIARRGPGGRGRKAYFDLAADGEALLARAWPAVTRTRSPQHFGLSERDARELERLLARVEANSPDAL